MAPVQKFFRGNFNLFLDSVERFSLVWVLSFDVRGVVVLLVVRCLGKYYSYVGRQISLSPLDYLLISIR